MCARMVASPFGSLSFLWRTTRPPSGSGSKMCCDVYWLTPIADSPRSCSVANAESLDAGTGLLLEQHTAATKKSRTGSFLDLPVTLGLPAARVGQLSRDAPIERGVGHFVFLFEAEGCPLQRVKNVAEVKLALRRRRTRCRQPCVRAGGIGVTSRSVLVDSAANTRTTTAVMLSFPPFMLASWIRASTIRSGLARDNRSC